MSRRRFVLHWVDLLSLSTLGPLEKLVALYIADRQRGTAPSFVGVDTIARELGTNRRQVFRALARLEAAGELVIERRLRRTSLYSVTRLSQPWLEPEGDAESPQGDTESRKGDAESPRGDAQSRSGDAVSPDPIRIRSGDPIRIRGEGAARPRRAARTRAARPPSSPDSLREKLSEALVDVYRHEQGITLIPEPRPIAKLEAWARRHAPGREVEAVRDVARTYLRSAEQSAQTRSWPLAWLVDRAPALARSSASDGRPSVNVERERAEQNERLAKAEDRAAVDARARGDDELAAAHEQSAKRLRGQLNGDNASSDRSRRGARSAEARQAP